MINYLTKLMLSDSNNITFYLVLSRDYLPSPTPIMSTCEMTWYDMWMRVGPKNVGQIPNAYDSSNLVSNQFWSENTAVQIYFKNSFIFGLGSYFWRKKIKSQEIVLEYFEKAGSVWLFDLRWGPRSRQPYHLVYIWLSARQCIFENL
jgi:hypothetical protein